MTRKELNEKARAYFELWGRQTLIEILVNELSEEQLEYYVKEESDNEKI